MGKVRVNSLGVSYPPYAERAARHRVGFVTRVLALAVFRVLNLSWAGGGSDCQQMLSVPHSASPVSASWQSPWPITPQSSVS